MLSRYDGKKIRLTTTDGEVFTGEAEAYASGYGLDTFGVEEESICINDTFIFLSQITRIEPPEPSGLTDAERMLYHTMTQELLDMPFRLVDHLPRRVPDDTEGQYFMVDRYFRQKPQLAVLHRRQAKILLRLNCFYDMAVTTDGGEAWEKNPDPERFVSLVDDLSGADFVRALFPSADAMIELCANRTQMTVVCSNENATELIRQLAAAEGMFLSEEYPDC